MADEFERLIQQTRADPVSLRSVAQSANLAPVDFTGKLLNDAFRTSETGIVNFSAGQTENVKSGIFSHGKTSVSFTLREFGDDIIFSIDPPAEGLGTNSLNAYKNAVNALRTPLGLPEINVREAETLAGGAFGPRATLKPDQIMAFHGQHQSQQQAAEEATRVIVKGATQGEQGLQQAMTQLEVNKTIAKGTDNEFTKLVHTDNPFEALLSKGANKGSANVELLAGTAALSSALAIGAKAAITHIMPAGIELAMQQSRANDVIELAEQDLHDGKLSQNQFDLIAQQTQLTVTQATAASLIPGDPGIGSDKAVQLGDLTLKNALAAQGISDQQAERYQLGSATQTLELLAKIATDKFTNSNDIELGMQHNGQVPLTTALNITTAELNGLGMLSQQYGGKALSTMLSHDPRYERLSELAVKDQTTLGNMAAAGLNPPVKVADGKITLASQEPILSKDTGHALQQARIYMLLSGDHTYRAPSNTSIALQASVHNLGRLQEKLSQDGGLSAQDIKIISMVAEQMTVGINNPQSKIMGDMVARYQTEQSQAQQQEQQSHAQWAQLAAAPG